MPPRRPPPPPVDPGLFAPWFDPAGRLRQPGRDRLEQFRRDLKLDDVAIEPHHRHRELDRPDPVVALLGSPRALLAIPRSYPAPWWWRTLAALSGQSVPYEFSASGGRTHVHGLGQWSHISSNGREPGIVDWMELDDFLPDAMQDAFGSGFLRDGEYGFGVAVIPRPGGPPSPYYSVKRDRWEPGVDPVEWSPCARQSERPYGSPNGPIAVRYRDLPFPITAAHVTREDALQELVACGGLLWPSFAVSWRPHLWTSDTYFFADARLLARNLSPTATRGSRDKAFILADTDTWTATAQGLLQHKARADAELRGDKEMTGNDLDALGLVVTPETSSMDEAAVVRTWPALARRLKGLKRVHGEAWEDVDHRVAVKDRYPYLELKLMDLMDVSECPLVVAPNDPNTVAGLRHLIIELNYSGEVLWLEKDGPTQYEIEHDEDLLRAWWETRVREDDFMSFDRTEAKRELDVRWARRVGDAVVDLLIQDPERWLLVI